MRALLGKRCNNSLVPRDQCRIAAVLSRSMFCQRINKQTGDSEWVVVEAPGELAVELLHVLSYMCRMRAAHAS